MINLTVALKRKKETQINITSKECIVEIIMEQANLWLSKPKGTP